MRMSSLGDSVNHNKAYPDLLICNPESVETTIPLNFMIDKIIFFISSPLDSRDIDRFGIEILESNGFETEVWDFTELINPERFNNYKPPDKSYYDKCRFISSKEKAHIEIQKRQGNILVVCLINWEIGTYFIFRALSKHRIPYSIYSYNYPSFNMKRKSIQSRLLNVTPAKLITYLFHSVPSKYLGIRPASIALILGGEFNSQDFAVGTETKILWSHNFDYEKYLWAKYRKVKPSTKTAVFLDQFYPFHPDDIPGNLPTADEYYPKLCKFFDDLEKRYDLHVIIAAHPRSDYNGREHLFGKRSVIRGNSVELVRDAEFVILHNSASISYAVLFRKPMIFITLSKLPLGERMLTEFIASLFGCVPIDVSEYEENSFDEELIVNEGRYTEYMYRYIKKSGTDDTPAWQVFADYLKKQNATMPQVGS